MAVKSHSTNHKSFFRNFLHVNPKMLGGFNSMEVMNKKMGHIKAEAGEMNEFLRGTVILCEIHT